jgi:hypothetical protein
VSCTNTPTSSAPPRHSCRAAERVQELGGRRARGLGGCGVRAAAVARGGVAVAELRAELVGHETRLAEDVDHLGPELLHNAATHLGRLEALGRAPRRCRSLDRLLSLIGSKTNARSAVTAALHSPHVAAVTHSGSPPHASEASAPRGAAASAVTSTTHQLTRRLDIDESRRRATTLGAKTRWRPRRPWPLCRRAAARRSERPASARASQCAVSTLRAARASSSSYPTPSRWRRVRMRRRGDAWAAHSRGAGGGGGRARRARRRGGRRGDVARGGAVARRRGRCGEKR